MSYREVHVVEPEKWYGSGSFRLPSRQAWDDLLTYLKPL